MFCELAHWRTCAKCQKIVIRCFVNLAAVHFVLMMFVAMFFIQMAE